MMSMLRGNALFLVMLCLLGGVSSSALAQTAPTPVQATIRTTRQTAVLERPRGDSLVIGSIAADVTLQVVGVQGRWLLIDAPAGEKWSRGWVLIRDRDTLAGTVRQMEAASRASLPPRVHRLRAYGQFGATFLTARKSAEAVFGKATGQVYGGGAQFIWPSGLFVQAGAERFAKTGSRVLVSGTQVRRLADADTLTMTPMSATVGFWQMSREAHAPVAGYAGVGGGLVSLVETSGASSTSDKRPEVHLLGGLEYRLRPGIWIGGEARWRSVPKAAGAGGLGEYYDERDLGGSTVLLKVAIGR